ncbi:glycosyltransferase [bacterium]|nr:glycosyltransferase [bacterium]
MIVASARSKSAARIRHYVAGGTEHGGGIGRLIGYIGAAPSRNSHSVTDTRGPKWDALRSPFRLAAAMGAMLNDRVLAPDRLHHLHIAGRGSTARKLILGGLARGLGCAHVIHLHDFDYAADYIRRPAWQKTAIRRLFQGADRVIVLGKRDRDTVVDLLRVAPAQVSVLHNAVPDPKAGGSDNPGLAGSSLAASGPRDGEAGSAAGPVRIVFLGQLGPRKGVPELLRALSRPLMQPLAWHAVLAGDGPVETYRAMAEDLGLADRVTLTGWLDQDRTRALCEEAEILVLPSHGEGMAMAVLEGLAHGLAVVTTPVGAHGEVISDGQTGVFVPVGDADALADALADLVAHPDLRRKIAAAGRAHYKSCLSIEAYMARLDALHHSLCPRPDEALPLKTGAS